MLFRSNQYIAAETSCVLNLWKDKSGGLELSTIKNRLAIQPEPFAVTRNENLTFKVDLDGTMSMNGITSKAVDDESGNRFAGSM